MSEKKPRGYFERNEFYNQNEGRLAELAWKAINVRHLSTNDFAIVCIDVDDKSWTELVDELMPGYDWNQFRRKGQKPVARGIVTRSTVDYIAKVVPDIAPALKTIYPPEIACGIVMAAKGATVYGILPRPQQ